MLALQCPSPGHALSRCLHKGCCGAVSSSFQKTGQSLEGADIPFSLRKPDQSKGTARDPGVHAAQPWEPGKLSSLIKLKSYTGKKRVSFLKL